MGTGRLEAFSDGVIAVIITIMVLELHPPHGVEFGALLEAAPTFLSYLLSFVFVAIYWNAHHHMFKVVKRIDGASLWANSHLLFWLSLVPFATNWMDENGFPTVPVAVYGGILFMCGIAFFILDRHLRRLNGVDARQEETAGYIRKEQLSLVIYFLGIAGAFITPWISGACYLLVAGMWLIPDKRLERAAVED